MADQSLSLLALALSLILVALSLSRVLRIGGRPAGYPPGPPTIPILGNIHQMPQRDPHLQFQKWARQYGPIFSLIIGTKTFIVLSSDTAVKDLMDKRSAIYSDRPDSYIGQDLCSGGLRLVLLRYGSQHRKFRKMAHNLLNPTAARSYLPYQNLENLQMMNEMLEKPTQFLVNIRRFSNSITTSIVFGWRTTRHDDPRLVQFFKGFAEFGNLIQTGTAQIFDGFPILQHIPGFILRVKIKAKRLHKAEKELYLGTWLDAKKNIQNGTARPCFCVGMARQQQELGLSDDQAGYMSGSLLEAGSDTTSSTLHGFLKAMVLFPEVQKRAQEDIDNIVGLDRMPDMDDEPKLQYIRGCVKETLRWMPTTILGVPHALMQDDEYMGYRLPKGAGIIANNYTIHMDPSRHPEPHKFDPDRYQHDFQNAAESAANPDASQRDHFVFGTGRRVCQGTHVAERSLFLAMSRLLWAFDIEPALDSNGAKIMPDPDKYTQGFVVEPEPFPAKITPRSKERAEVIRCEWKQAQEQLDPLTGQWEKIPKGMTLPSL